jgi:hypothetical protein
LGSSGCRVAAPVAEAFFGGMTKVMLAEGVQSSKNGSEFTGGGRQCWKLVLKCYESRTRQHKMLKAFMSTINNEEKFIYKIGKII